LHPTQGKKQTQAPEIAFKKPWPSRAANAASGDRRRRLFLGDSERGKGDPRVDRPIQKKKITFLKSRKRKKRVPSNQTGKTYPKLDRLSLKPRKGEISAPPWGGEQVWGMPGSTGNNLGTPKATKKENTSRPTREKAASM